MITDFFFFLRHRLHPRDGWLPVSLGLLLLIWFNTALTAAQWLSPEQQSPRLLPFAYLYGILLAHTYFSRRQAAILTLFYTPFIIAIPLANLIPSLSTLTSLTATLTHIRLNLALLTDRLLGWGTAVIQGETTGETAVLALLILLISWFFGLSLGWQMTHTRQATRTLLAGTLLMTLNTYFGPSPFLYLALYLATATLLIALLNYLKQRHQWQQDQADYSDEILLDLLGYTFALAFLIFSLTALAPALPYNRLAQQLRQHPLALEVEDSWERLFGQRLRALSGNAPRRRGTMPRSFLLGSPAKLSTTVVMTATISPPPPITARYWHALSYDIYTTRGWTIGQEREQKRPANTPLALPTTLGTQTSRQNITWLFDDRLTRYTLGTPQQFDDATTLFLLGQSDLTRIHGLSTQYSVISQIPNPDLAALRLATLRPPPDALLARYTTLPADLPDRIHNEANRVAGHLTNPYDQARTLENYLRQFPYDLDVSLPPADQDPVDYFLFDLQRGYCDYYASAMVIMARSLGIPARLSIGYLSSQPGATNQTIYQSDGHAWPEIYFANYGWLPFEPTAAYTPLTWQTTIATLNPQTLEGDPEPAFPEETFPPPPIPEPQSTSLLATIPRLFSLLLSLTLIVTAIFIYYYYAPQPTPQNLITDYQTIHQYAQKMGHPSSPHLTPHEFGQSLNQHITHQHQQTPFPFSIVPFQNLITTITTQFTNWRYAQPQAPPPLDNSLARYQRPLNRHTRWQKWRKWHQKTHATDDQ